MNFKNWVAGKLRRLRLLGVDCLCFALVAAGYYFANLLFEPHLSYTPKIYLANAGILLLATLVVRFAFGIYQEVFRYVRTVTYVKMVLADALSGAVATFFSWLCGLYQGIWMFLIVATVNALATLFSRFCYRMFYKYRHHENDGEKVAINVAIVGAGQIGANLAGELIDRSGGKYNPVMFIDSDPVKIGNRLAGLKIYPEDQSVYNIMQDHKISEIFIAIDHMNNETSQKLLAFYGKTPYKLKLYDVPVKDFAETEQGSGNQTRTIRNFEIEDLLFRKQLKVSGKETVSYYAGKTVLITGGGGSIGSELCRQVAKCVPEHLIIFDIYENNAYDIQQELLRKYGERLKLTVEIGSVREPARLESIFQAYRPQVVFHAAAHKHVPLMEHSGGEAVKNNIFGTQNTADMAEKYGAEKFILISTDKAVNPTNVMGASKRMCEMIVQCRTDSKTSFAAVRFGNVLGSNGSVIPLFKQQIEQGGPLTITDKRIIRYFMTIPEAAQLVMEAGAMAKSGQLFVLDMGKPVKIYDLAVNMIRLSGLVPEKDIEIKEIGLRPGEKLFEELLIETEKLESTENSMIFIERDAPLTREEIDRRLAVLSNALERTDGLRIGSEEIKAVLHQVVETYVSPEEVNRTAEQSKEMALVGK